MKKIVLVSLLGVGLLFTGCHKRVKLTPAQEKEITSRSFNVEYNKLFTATLMAFQDSGYSIDTSDKDTGVIRGESDKTTSELSKSIQIALTGRSTSTRTHFKVNAIIVHDANQSTVNLMLLKSEYGKEGNIFNYREVQKSSKKILDKKVYDEFFQKINQNL